MVETTKMTSDRALRAAAEASVHDPRLFADLQVAAMGEEVQSHPIQLFIQNLITACAKAHVHAVAVAPPEHAKSTQIVFRCAWEACKNPRLRTGFISADYDLAQRNLILVRKTLLNPITRMAFPDVKPDIRRGTKSGEWSKTKLYFEDQEWPAFEAFALDGSNEGVRLDCAWMDDTVGRKCSRSEAERDRAHSAIHNTWLSRMTGKGIAIISNNVWHRADPIHKMCESESFCVLWIGYIGTEKIYWRVHHPPKTWEYGEEGTLPLWDRWPQERLIKRRNEDPLTYKRLYNQKAMLAEECRFPPCDEWATYNHLPPPNSGERIYAFLDPSGGKRVEKEDYAALIVVMVMPNREVYLVDAIVSKMLSPTQQISACFDMHEKWIRMGYRQGIYMMGFEVLPKDEKWIVEPIERERSRRREDNREWRLNIQIRHPRENKESRIERLEPWLRNGWLKFPYNIVDMGKGRTSSDLPYKHLIEQIEDFPFGDNDDGPDALSGAIDLAAAHGVPDIPTEPVPESASLNNQFELTVAETVKFERAAQKIVRPKDHACILSSDLGLEDFDLEFG